MIKPPGNGWLFFVYSLGFLFIVNPMAAKFYMGIAGSNYKNDKP